MSYGRINAGITYEL